MDESILNSTKKVLGLTEDYTAFDPDIIMHINSVFGVLNQIGIGTAGFRITDSEPEWSDFTSDENVLQMLPTYMSMKVRMVFDPPATSFALDALKNQLEEYETRLSWFREATIPVPE